MNLSISSVQGCEAKCELPGQTYEPNQVSLKVSIATKVVWAIVCAIPVVSGLGTLIAGVVILNPLVATLGSVLLIVSGLFTVAVIRSLNNLSIKAAVVNQESENNQDSNELDKKTDIPVKTPVRENKPRVKLVPKDRVFIDPKRDDIAIIESASVSEEESSVEQDPDFAYDVVFDILVESESESEFDSDPVKSKRGRDLGLNPMDEPDSSNSAEGEVDIG